MAFVMRIEDVGEVIMFDFLDSSGLVSEVQSYTVDRDEDGDLIENMLIISRVRDSSAARTAARDLSDIGDKVKRWFDDQTEARSIWWVMNTDGELPKRALISELTIELENLNENPSWFLTEEQGAYRLRITHSENFEEKATVSLISSSKDIPMEGGIIPLDTSTLNTNDDSRIEVFLASAFFLTTRDMHIIWVGILPFLDSGAASRSNFDPILDSTMTLAPIAGDDTSLIADPTSGGHGNVYSIDFATDATIAPRVAFRNSVDGFQGSYHLLALTYIDSTAATKGKIGVEVSVSTSSPMSTINLSKTLTDRIYIPAPRSTTSDSFDEWKFVDLGIIQLPNTDYRSAAQEEDQSFFVTLNANRITGTCKMYLARIVLIPSAHFFNVYSPVQNSFDESRMITITNEDYTSVTQIDRSTALSPILDAVIPSTTLWAFPREGGVIVACAGEDTGNDGNTGFSIRVDSIDVFPTWKIYAGEV